MADTLGSLTGAPRRNIPPEAVRELWAQGQQGMQPQFLPTSLWDLAVNNPVSQYLGEVIGAGAEKLAEISPEYLAAVPMTLTAMVRGPKGKAIRGKAAEVISDWKWRPAAKVASELNLSELPAHIQPFGNFMVEQAAKARAGELSTRDLIKAFTLTRASIQRSAINAANVPLQLNLPAGAKIRPEGAFAEWLLTPNGQKYLNAAEKGIVDEEAIKDAVRTMKPFGKADTDIPDALRWAAANLPGKEAEWSPIIAKAATGQKALGEWRKATEDVRGVGLAKQGFLGSMLGYGQLPTLDARQIVLHTGAPTKEASPYLARRSGLGGQAAVDRLAKRQEMMNVNMPEEYKPFYQHLTHHAVWDKAANEATTHEDLIRAMKMAGIIGGAVTLSDLVGRPQDNDY